LDLVAIGCLLDLLDNVVDLSNTSWVDSSALLLACTAANVGSNIVQDRRLGDIDHIELAKGGGNGKFILLGMVTTFRGKFQNF